MNTDSRMARKPGTLQHSKGRIIIDMPIDEAWDLIHCFPATDGFAQDLIHLVTEAEEWLAAIES